MFSNVNQSKFHLNLIFIEELTVNKYLKQIYVIYILLHFQQYGYLSIVTDAIFVWSKTCQIESAIRKNVFSFTKIISASLWLVWNKYWKLKKHFLIIYPNRRSSRKKKVTKQFKLSCGIKKYKATFYSNKAVEISWWISHAAKENWWDKLGKASNNCLLNF